MRFCGGAFALWILCGCASEPGQHAKRPTRSADITIDDVLGWLPRESQTVIAAQRPFAFPAPDTEAVSTGSLDDVFRAVVIAPLREVGDDQLGVKLAGRRVQLAVEGTTRFGKARIGGTSPYSGVHIVVFERSLPPDVLAELRTLGTAMSVEGHDVLVFRKKTALVSWTFYLAKPMPNVLVCATGEAELKEALQRMGKAPTAPALPPVLENWKVLGKKGAPVWGIRVLRDSKEIQGITLLSLVFQTSPVTDGKAASLSVKIEGPNAKDSLAWLERNLNQPSSEGEAGFQQFSLRIENKKELIRVTLVVMMYLGHAILP